MKMNDTTDRILAQKNFWLEKMHQAVDALGVASFNQDTDKVEHLMFDLETYRICVEKFDRQMHFALTS